ncbi:MAG TPA: hypothetical protein DEE98_07165 [Elusimicrobia bacterium]|nr:MAG: hypothetical protein A2278_00200 [Elusimicrobia bacterium RIFOXYA12_FULL_49_49]OGS09486.1 MAG: hypothetical protein A2204_00555 [Elusimicrobia bacterium RIFOXYA1_FULL_47_7]OGS10635.1 MAG: hypothetical protein A2386_02800 [Elusimicrobia bacterium RIFOXYB1_FULL_48_9]OGS15856.1 MAG: hypothetical protein A2251_04335 [Elusimicrobia bacterium RIFOXYA2_FULL_47_53]OGS27150.1 MAG: hypothetical protein A2339_00585 [Elusimicrobia bacterium RIFOXYB12_FULL_50_12]OGS31188.1 MAG: hypothetical protein
MKGEERRKYIRVFLPAGQMRILSGPLLVLVGKIIDISVGGVKFSAESEYANGDTVELEITLPNSVKFKCSAEIVGVAGTGKKENKKLYMAKFVSLSAGEQEMLGEFIETTKAEQDSILWNELN